jgi:pimeloyl-ACP methyl ester carboxylesterase
VTVCGISLGGWIAVRLALARPDLVARLLLVVPGGYREQDWERIGRMVRVETYRDSAAIWQALFVRPPLLLRLGRPLLYLAYRSEAVRAALGTLREDDAFGDIELATLKMPVGLIWGAEDRLFLSAAGERMARAIPHARFAAIADAGHGVQWERPRKFFEAVETFRRDLPLS